MTTVESPHDDSGGNSKLNREIAAIFKNAERPEPVAPFPKIRIEALGLDVLRDLDNLTASMTTEELDASPEGADILANFYNNDKFVRERIAPLVSGLMERSTQVVYLTSKENIGYVHMEGSDDGEVSTGIYLLREEDRLSENYDPAHTKERIQDLWDTSSQYVRLDIKAFAARTKGDLIDMFYRFARDYAMPQVDFDGE